jgi:hypothetical protein
LVTLLLTSLIISLFCCGLTEISREGRVLYFLRQPFEGLDELLMILRGEEDKRYTRTQLFSIKVAGFISKPLILCPTCMASIWGVVIFCLMHGFYVSEIPAMIVCCIMSAFINSFLSTLLEKLEA